MSSSSPEVKTMYAPDPIKEGELDVKRIEDNARATGKVPADEVEKEVKKDIAARESLAANVRKKDWTRGEIPGDDLEAQNVTKTVSMFIEAVNKGYITRPTHPPTAALFDSLVTQLRVNRNTRTAVYLQPLIRGVLHIPNYVQFAGGTTQFEQDLKKITAGLEAHDEIDELVDKIFNWSGIPPADLAEIQNQLKAERERKMADMRTRRKEADKRSGGFSEAERRYIDDLFENDDTGIARDIKGDSRETPDRDPVGLLKAIETPEAFYGFYKRIYARQLRKYEVPGKDLEESELDNARRDATMYMHKCFMYLTHRIFSQVIEGAGHNNWSALNQATGRGYGVTSEQIFRHVRRNLSEMQHNVKLFGDFNFELDETTKKPKEDEHRHKKVEKYFQLGDESIHQWETKKEGSEYRFTQMREVPVISSEMTEVHGFKDFIERFNNALGAERDLLEVGINFNYLMNTGHAEHEGASFFQQAAEYAGHSLGAGRIDELYRLPYNEIVHAARIQLANEFKRVLALNKWQKDPKFFSGIFQHANTSEHHVLVDMIKSQLKNEEEWPEWAIRRALLHARMHMSLISVDYHAISSYAHPALTDDLKPTYLDTSMAHLETFNTWFDATKWQTTELFRYGMAFMPAPNRQWMQDVWLPEDVKDEGETIWKHSENLGEMSLIGRTYFTPETPLNIMELNPMGVGGVEKQSGWGIKYPYTPWIDDLINQPTSNENFHLRHVKRDKEGNKMLDAKGEEILDKRDFELAWKRLENLGIEILRNYKDTYLFGKNNSFLEMKDGNAQHIEHYKNFYTFLFERYFKEGVGREAQYSIEFRDQQLNKYIKKYSDYKSGEEFWKNVIEPILTRKDFDKGGEKDFDPKSYNQNDKVRLLKTIVDQALGVIMFERLPVDMVMTEDPLRSQNGRTFLEELQIEFIEGEGGTGRIMDKDTFVHTFADLDYVQGIARTKSIEEIRSNLSAQRLINTEKKPEGFTTFGRTLEDMDKLRSSIIIADSQKDGRSPTGYIIDEHIVEDILTEKYKRILNSREDHDIQSMDDVHAHVHHAVELYKAIRRRIVKKPDYSYLESHSDELVDDKWAKREIKFEKNKGDLAPSEETEDILKKKKQEIKERLKREFADHRENKMLTRLHWSGKHLLDPKVPITINDVAYPLLYFSATGNLLVNRRLNQIAGTQEKLKGYIMGEYDSDLKKYYRKEDQEALLKSIIDVRNRIKEWLGPDEYNGTAMFILENSMNVMRIRSDAENALVEMQMRAAHKKRSAISGVATEGEEYPLRRQERYNFINEFMHSGQFPKHTAPGDMVFEVQDPSRRAKIMEMMSKLGPNGEKAGELIANVADLFLGKEEAKIIRQAWKERSGNALRDRQMANVVNLLFREGPTILVLVLAGLMILSMVKGFQEAEM